MLLKIINPPRNITSAAKQRVLHAYSPAKTEASRENNEALMRALFADRPLEKAIRSHWVAYPALRDASRTLLEILGPEWSESGERDPLFMRAVEDATEAAIRATHEEGVGGRGAVAAYLAQLCQTASQYAEYPTHGYAADGEAIRWPGLNAPMHEWITRHGIQRIEVGYRQTLSSELLRGYRGVLLSRIAAPEAVGLTWRLLH